MELMSSRSKIQASAIEMSYLRGGCGVNRMDGESNENVYVRFDIASEAEGISCEVVVKHTEIVWIPGKNG